MTEKEILEVKDHHYNENIISESSALGEYGHEINVRKDSMLERDIVKEDIHDVKCLKSEYNESIQEVDSNLKSETNILDFLIKDSGSSMPDLHEPAIAIVEAGEKHLPVGDENNTENQKDGDTKHLNTESMSMTVSSVTSDTVSPVETPETEHAKGFYEVNPGHYPDESLKMESSTLSASGETISPIETPEHEHTRGFYEVNPVIRFSPSEEFDDKFDDNFASDSKMEALNAELQGTFLQNIAIGKISSPVDSPSDYNVTENYKINPLIPDITIEEDIDSKSDVFDIADLDSIGLTKDEKFIEMTTNLVTSVINGAIKYVVDMKQVSDIEKDRLSQVVSKTESLDTVSRLTTKSHTQNMADAQHKAVCDYEATNITIQDTSEIIPYPIDSDSDDSAGSSTTTEGSYRIINSRDTSPLNTPDTSAVEDFSNVQRDTGVKVEEDDIGWLESKRNKVTDDMRKLDDAKNTEELTTGSKNKEDSETDSTVEVVRADIMIESDQVNNNVEEVKQKADSNVMVIGETVDISESSSDSSDYMKQHKSEYTTRKQIFMTSAGRMSISIDSVADHISDPDQMYMVTEHDTIQEETHAEVGYILARTHSIIGHADETLARLNDAAIARLRDLADATICEDIDVVCDSSSWPSEVELPAGPVVSCMLSGMH